MRVFGLLILAVKNSQNCFSAPSDLANRTGVIRREIRFIAVFSTVINCEFKGVSQNEK